MNQFNEQDTNAIRSGVLGAIAYVSHAEPGFFATFKESVAASKVLQGAPQGFRELMTGGLVAPPKIEDRSQVEQTLLDNLAQAVQVADQDPETGRALRNYVLTACQEVAQAAKGVSAEESAAIDQVRRVLDQAPSSHQAADRVQQPDTEGTLAENVNPTQQWSNTQLGEAQQRVEPPAER